MNTRSLNDFKIDYIHRSILLMSSVIYYFDLCDAVENRDILGVKKFLQLGADVHANDNFLLRYAARTGLLEIVQELIKYGADIHEHHNEALRMAALNNHFSVVEELVKHGADVHACNEASLYNACSTGNITLIKFFLDHEADLHKREDELLILSAQEGEIEIIHLLIQYGADIQILCQEAYNNPNFYFHESIVRLFIDQGLDYYRNNQCILWAISYNNIIRSLTTQFTYDILCQESKLDIIRLLIQNGAVTRFQSKSDYMQISKTVLHLFLIHDEEYPHITYLENISLELAKQGYWHKSFDSIPTALDYYKQFYEILNDADIDPIITEVIYPRIICYF